jgi:hypothetical protein
MHETGLAINAKSRQISPVLHADTGHTPGEAPSLEAGTAFGRFLWLETRADNLSLPLIKRPPALELDAALPEGEQKL